MKIILVVDGEQSFHNFYTDILEDTGYTVISVYDGEEALSKMEEMNPDLIIIDELILMDIISNKMTDNTPSLYTKSTTEFGDIPFIKSSDFFLRSFKDQMRTGPGFALPDKTFIKEKLVDEVNAKIEQKATVCS